MGGILHMRHINFKLRLLDQFDQNLSEIFIIFKYFLKNPAFWLDLELKFEPIKLLYLPPICGLIKKIN